MSRLFISYRRSDSEEVTGRIYDRLVSRYGHTCIFKDVDSIPHGVDFREHVHSSIQASRVMLVVIGRGWVTVQDDAGQRRLNDPDDFVRIEIETGLSTPGMILIPVLVSRAGMPARQELPPSLQKLVYLNASQVRPDPDFNDDLQDLIEGINPHMGSGWNRLWQRVPARSKQLSIIVAVGVSLLLAGLAFFLSDTGTKFSSAPASTLSDTSSSGAGKPDTDLNALDTKRLVAAYYAAKTRLLDDRVLTELVTVAYTQLTKKEDSTSNKGARIDKYLKSIDMPPGFGWSQAFVHWCFEQATKKYNQQNPVLKTGSVSMFVAAAEKQNVHILTSEDVRNNPALIRPGMVFCVARGTGRQNDYVHSGIVLKAYPDYVETIEGNTTIGGQIYGTGVFRRIRNFRKSNIIFVDYGHQQD